MQTATQSAHVTASSHSLQGSFRVVSILKMKKQRHREVRFLAQHPAALSGAEPKFESEIVKFHGLGFAAGGTDGKESDCNAGDLGSIPGSGRSPGEGMANHSSIFAWRIPWTEEPGGLQSMESQRVGHN